MGIDGVLTRICMWYRRPTQSSWLWLNSLIALARKSLFWSNICFFVSYYRTELTRSFTDNRSSYLLRIYIAHTFSLHNGKIFVAPSFIGINLELDRIVIQNKRGQYLSKIMILLVPIAYAHSHTLNVKVQL